MTGLTDEFWVADCAVSVYDLIEVTFLLPFAGSERTRDRVAVAMRLGRFYLGSVSGL